jgi:MFS family permease
VKEIKKIYWMYFFGGLSNAASVTFTLYFLSHGLKQVQIGELFGFFLICLAIFDIPTGGIADMFGHKASVGFGLFLQAISFLLFFLYPTYYGFLLGMFADALGLAFQSGATSSLIYELLHKEGLHEDFQKIYGRANGYFLIGSLIASPLGSLIYIYYPSLPYFLAFIFFLLATTIVYFIKWEFVKMPPKISTYFNTITSGIKLTVKNRVLLSIVIMGTALTINRMISGQNIQQPYLVSVGVNVAYIGTVAAIISAFLAIVSIYSYKISKRLGKTLSLLLILAVPSLGTFILGFTTTLIAIPIIIFCTMGHAFRDPVFAHIGQGEVDKDKRSTMASTVSFLTSVIAGLLLPYGGRSIDLFGLHNTLLYLGIVTFFVGGLGFILFEYKK